MSSVNLDELLKKMNSIAEAVNKFSSESVQLQAFEALMQSAGVDIKKDDNTTTIDPPQQTPDDDQKAPKATSGSKRAKGAKKIIAADKNINLRPQGKISFRDFAEQKSPTNQHERNVVAVHYLIDVLEIQEVSLPQILACYRDAAWKLPSDIANSLQQTGSNGWVDSRDSNNILLTSPGRNAVEFDLPKANK